MLRSCNQIAIVDLCGEYWVSFLLINSWYYGHVACCSVIYQLLWWNPLIKFGDYILFFSIFRAILYTPFFNLNFDVIVCDAKEKYMVYWFYVSDKRVFFPFSNQVFVYRKYIVQEKQDIISSFHKSMSCGI